jgi:tight adherence protein B
MTYFVALMVGAGLLMVFLGLAARVRAQSEMDDAAEETPFETFINAITAPLVRGGGAAATSEMLAGAGVRIRPQNWYAIRLAFIAGGFLLVFSLDHSLFVAIISAGIAYLIPGVWLRIQRAQRQAALTRQLPEAMVLMSNSLEGGAALLQSVEAVAATIAAPISEEFSRVVREIRLGVPMEEALHRMARRVDSRDFFMLVSAVEIHRQMGGSLAIILHSITDTMRQRIQLTERMRVLTAQSRVSGYIVTALPFVLAFFLLIIAPSYMGKLFTHPLGFAALTLSLLMVAVAYIVIGRITDIEV